MWTIRFTRRVAREVGRLPHGVVIRLQAELNKLSRDPYRGRKLEGLEGYRWRFGAPGGEWRIFYQVYAETKEVYVVAITTREKAPY